MPRLSDHTPSGGKLPPIKSPAKPSTRAVKKPAAVKSEEAVETPTPPPVNEVIPADEDKLSTDTSSVEETSNHLTVMYYGRPGTGKTTAALSMANLGEGLVLVINAEQGVDKRALQRRGIAEKNIRVWPKVGERPTFRALKDLFVAREKELAKDPNSWAGCVIDTGTALSEVLLEAIVKRRLGSRSQTALIAKWDDYLELANQWRELIRMYKYLPWHFVITAQRREKNDEDGNLVSSAPYFTPAVAEALIAAANMVVRTDVETVEEKGKEHKEYVGLTSPGEIYEAKDRSGTLPERIVNPTFDEIVKIYNGEAPF